MTKVRQVMLALICLIAISTLASGAQPVRTGDVTKRGLSESDFPLVRKLVPNVYAYSDVHTALGTMITTNSLIIVTADGVVLVDGQDSVERGRVMVRKIKEITPQPVKYAVIASYHGDHSRSNPAIKEAFPDVTFVSSPAGQEALKTSANPPTEVVAKSRTLHVGGTEIQILNMGRGHTTGDLVVYLPASKILFTSELYFSYMFPGVGSGFPSDLANAIKTIQAMDVSWYLPGHGFIDDPASMKADLNEYRQALEYLVAEGKRVHAAGYKCPSPTDCPAAKAVNWRSYGDYTLFGLAPRDIERVYREIEGKL